MLNSNNFYSIFSILLITQASSMEAPMIDEEQVGSQRGETPMDLDLVNHSHGVANDDSMSLDDSNRSILRRESLLLATFPWFSGIIMTPNKLCESLGRDHYGYVCTFCFFLNPFLFL
jgi:hypothetical protein